MVLGYFQTISFGFNGTTTMAHDSEYLKKDHVFSKFSLCAASQNTIHLFSKVPFKFPMSDVIYAVAQLT